MRKYFSPEEANRLVPMLRTELMALQRISEEVAGKMARLRALRTHAAAEESENRSQGNRVQGKDGPDPVVQLEFEIEQAALEARVHAANIARTGAELKSVELGLIDFPAWKDGVEVCLCWRMDEEKVAHWHGKEAGYPGRMPIEE